MLVSGLLDTGMTTIVWWSVIINEAGLHHWTGGVAFRKVAVVMMTRSPIRTMFVVFAVLTVH